MLIEVPIGDVKMGAAALYKVVEFSTQISPMLRGELVLVGSSIYTRNFEDIDLRANYAKQDFDVCYGFIEPPYIFDQVWRIQVLAYSLLGKELTGGLPIDFQIHRMNDTQMESNLRDMPFVRLRP